MHSARVLVNVATSIHVHPTQAVAAGHISASSSLPRVPPAHLFQKLLKSANEITYEECRIGDKITLFLSV